MKQKEDKDYGWWTDRETKLRFAYNAQRQMVTGSVFMLADYVCTNPFVPALTRRSECTKKFINQMIRYKLTATTPTTAFATQKVTVSGKVNEQGKLSEGFNDDLFFTFTFVCDMVYKVLERVVPSIDYSLLFNDR